jgi:hypothetical protein
VYKHAATALQGVRKPAAMRCIVAKRTFSEYQSGELSRIAADLQGHANNEMALHPSPDHTGVVFL